MEAISDERDERRLDPEEDAARKRAALETYARNEAALRRTAHRYSLCADDAEDALQRGLEILLRKAPSDDPRYLIKWTQTVVKHEALSIRRERENTLGPAGFDDGHDTEDWVALLPASTDGPPERAERRETVARSREALQALKPQELRALTLLAEGYSYIEIGEMTGYSPTKINRCLAEGRERFRRLIARSEGGERCREMQPLISAFCDGEARAEALDELREHLRACQHCRATLRAYRAAPTAASALAPVLPLQRSFLERAHDSLAELLGRFGGAGGQATTGGAGGIGAVGLAKVAIVCVGAAGGVAACAVTGVGPFSDSAPAERDRAARVEPRPVAEPAPEQPEPEVDPKPDPAPTPQSESDPSPPPRAPAESETVAEPAPASEGEPVESAPPPPEPAPEPAPAPVSSSGGGSPAGEFGP